MPLKVLASPGCDAVGKDAYLESALGADDVVISVARIYKALTGSSGVPSENPPVLRLALGLRSVAIRSAREKQLSGFILTSNGSRAHLDRLADEAGADAVTVLTMTETQACARVGRLVTGAARLAACEEGIYQATAQSRNAFSADQEGPPINVSRGFLLSGAQGLLSPWRQPRAGACR